LYKDATSTSNIGTEKEKVDKPERLLELLCSIFYETTRYPIIFEEYLKLLLNSISESETIKKSFTLNCSNQRESFLSIILNYFNKNLNNLNNNPNFELFIKFLKSLFQSRAITNCLLKMRFIESLLAEIEKSNIFTNFTYFSIFIQKVP